MADDRLVLVAVGRLVPQKDYPFMLRIVKRLDDAMLLVAGEGPLRRQLMEEVKALGITDRVRRNVMRDDRGAGVHGL
jgi:glycosyltransferase involved in cell wall biosynthesis